MIHGVYISILFKATAASQSIKEKCKQFVEAQAKEVDAVKRDNVSLN